MVTRYSITAKGNGKTGAATINTRSTSNTCPKTCPHLISGACYAKQGHERLWWDRLDRNESIKSGDWLWLQERLKEINPKLGTLLRHNTAGDLSHENGRISSFALRMLTVIFTSANVTPYTYTHHRQDGYNLSLINDAINAGFVINLSCDSEEQASKRTRAGFPCTVVVPHDDERTKWIDDYGVRFQTCPAQLSGVSCDACRLCAKATGPKNQDRAVVVFRAHGAKKKAMVAA